MTYFPRRPYWSWVLHIWMTAYIGYILGSLRSQKMHTLTLDPTLYQTSYDLGPFLNLISFYFKENAWTFGIYNRITFYSRFIFINIPSSDFGMHHGKLPLDLIAELSFIYLQFGKILLFTGQSVSSVLTSEFFWGFFALQGCTAVKVRPWKVKKPQISS